jgi:hypothetical protein
MFDLDNPEIFILTDVPVVVNSYQTSLAGLDVEPFGVPVQGPVTEG